MFHQEDSFLNGLSYLTEACKAKTDLAIGIGALLMGNSFATNLAGITNHLGAETMTVAFCAAVLGPLVSTGLGAGNVMTGATRAVIVGHPAPGDSAEIKTSRAAFNRAAGPFVAKQLASAALMAASCALGFNYFRGSFSVGGLGNDAALGVGLLMAVTAGLINWHSRQNFRAMNAHENAIIRQKTSGGPA